MEADYEVGTKGGNTNQWIRDFTTLAVFCIKRRSNHLARMEIVNKIYSYSKPLLTRWYAEASARLNPHQ